jgi:hypothetical protein
MRKYAEVTATKIHFPDDEIELLMCFGITYWEHFPENFQIGNNTFKRRVVITGQKDFSDSLKDEKWFFRRATLLMKKSEDFVDALTVKEVRIVEGESAQGLFQRLAQN